ncbi:MgtC/SapB family protein [Spirosoma utsteinense]|uniref:Mg2+ transporter-C (MgtC) family protein n=1 Tax=Spirosoma utsteinense TaxID=2585773 RepID=A0ABR6W3S5_9BACT|nr:MgtC/SapB family protein [Spirosoma utsteinense]MBC3784773.1 putative Mg2+ transporter-C (MgtC) family protein [Spirosoma utsteinense]MBC3791190.1 putative Mg2+ transporter-C (MgtC) family protein [Spirosoma utsteinense]
MAFAEEDSIRLVVALLMGGLIGAEREYNGKAAGFRTMIMICVGSALFTIVSGRIGGAGDRIAANIVNGIGFLGAGIIFREENRIKGLTTAATVWAVSALGMSLGGGLYDLALIGFGIIMGALLLLTGLSKRIGRANQTRDYRIVTAFRHKTLYQYENFFTECGLSPTRNRQQRIGTDIIGQWRVQGSEKSHEKCIKRLLNDPEVKEFTF